MSDKLPEKKLTIRNSTAEFLIFTQQAGENGIEVRYEDGSIWLTQRLMAELFDVTTANVNTHIKNIYEEKELVQNLTIKEFLIVQKEGERQVSRSVDHYNLDVIISVGYRVNSKRATQFRQWATQVLKEFAIKGFVLDKKRLENGSFLGEDYFEGGSDPVMAPKERDLMFIGGGVANVWNKAHEEVFFYKGYGQIEINMTILAYYRHERIVEDIAEYGQDLLLTTAGGENRSEMYKHFIAMFDPWEVVDIAFKTDESLYHV